MTDMQTLIIALIFASPVSAGPTRFTFPTDVTDSGNGVCDPYADGCNSAMDKVPPVTPTVPNARTMETALVGPHCLTDDACKKQLEHAFGNALRETEPVKWMTREYGQRLYRFLVEGENALNGLTPDAALFKYFVGTGNWAPSTKCNKAMTGWAGGKTSNIADILLKDGNIREVFVYAYCIFGTEGGPYDLSRLFEGLSYDWFKQNFNLNAANAVKSRKKQVLMSKQLADSERGKADPYFAAAQGEISWCWPPMQTWARFDFPSKWWKAARKWPDSAHTIGLKSDDASLYPPLSARELAAECRNSTPCDLSWVPGSNYEVSEQTIDGMPGYKKRAEKLGYRIVAGPSSTTGNAMQLALMLGFSGTDLVILRATMMAWMLPSDDHSFYEIMLAAEPYVPRPFGLTNDWHDLSQVWPAMRGITVNDDVPSQERRLLGSPCDVPVSSGGDCDVTATLVTPTPVVVQPVTFMPEDIWPKVREWFNANLTGSVCQIAQDAPEDKANWADVLQGDWICAQSGSRILFMYGATSVKSTTTSMWGAYGPSALAAFATGMLLVLMLSVRLWRRPRTTFHTLLEGHTQES